jgi:transposase-like protein
LRHCSRGDSLIKRLAFCAFAEYLRYKLSTRDLVEMMAERGVSLVHTTILLWVQHYVPEFEKCWSQYAAGRRFVAV